MRYAKANTELAEAIQDFVERVVSIGVARNVAERAISGAEWECVLDLRQADEDQRLLDLFARYDTVDIAKRYSLSPRRMRDKKKEAENRQKDRRTASAKAA